MREVAFALGKKAGDDVLVFMYDDTGDIFGFTYNGDEKSFCDKKW